MRCNKIFISQNDYKRLMLTTKKEREILLDGEVNIKGNQLYLYGQCAIPLKIISDMNRIKHIKFEKEE